MRKNTCPYLDAQGRCMYKRFDKGKKYPVCQFNNPKKCQLHNQWLNSRKSFRMAKNDDEALLITWVNQMKRKWSK